MGNVFPERADGSHRRIEAWVKHQFALTAFKEVVSVLGTRGIDVLPVKGIVLAYTLYENVEERPMFDIDLRVRPRDLARVAEAARDEGWVVRRTSRQLGTLEFCLSRTLVEIETTVGPPGLSSLTISDMLARSVRRAAPAGITISEPELHDHTLLLCVNAFKDKLVNAHPWAREDLLRIACVPSFMPSALVRRATEAKLRTVVYTVASWLSRDARAVPWQQVLAAMEPPPRPIYRATYDALTRTAPDSLVTAIAARAGSDVFWRRLQAVGLGFAGTLLHLARQFRGPKARDC